MGNKVIIVKKEDGGVVRIIPNHAKYGEGLDKDGQPKKPFTELDDLKKYIAQGLKWFACDNNDLPAKSAMESRKQWYHDGDKVKVDTNWELRVMPDHLIKKKQLKKLAAKLDQCIDSGDALEALKAHRDHEKCKTMEAGIHNEDKVWTELALANLDKRVADGQADKPVIREKLLKKIKELK